jgi:hypothetical protein
LNGSFTGQTRPAGIDRRQFQNGFAPTRLIFFELPRGAYPPPDGYAVPHNDRTPVRMLARRPRVLLDDETGFQLKDPALFVDAHFNLLGSARFSPMFAQRVRALFGPPAT